MRHLVLILAWLCLLPAAAEAGSNHHNNTASSNSVAASSSNSSAHSSSNAGSTSKNEGDDVEAHAIALGFAQCTQAAGGEGFAIGGQSRFCECQALYAVTQDADALACMREEAGLDPSPLGQATGWLKRHVLRPLVEPIPFLGQHAY